VFDFVTICDTASAPSKNSKHRPLGGNYLVIARPCKNNSEMEARHGGVQKLEPIEFEVWSDDGSRLISRSIQR
jgi:hypothetical protein